MIKKLFLGLAAATLITACSEPSSSSDSATHQTQDTPPDTTTNTNNAPASTTSSELACVNGSYDFRTDSDGKFHFHATFDGAGNVIYHINGAPRGTYTVSGSSLAFVGPFGPNFSDATLNWRINGCVATELRGTSLGGEASLTATRR